jgi:hypothetical protein
MFRFAVNVGPSRSRAEQAGKARKLEDLGCATLTVPDHSPTFLCRRRHCLAPRRGREGLRVGTNALNNDFRHPLLVARQAATVDLLTEGRLQLGSGAVHKQSGYEQAGLDFDAGGIRSSGWQRLSPSSRVCSMVNRSPSQVGIIA